jgi:predicted anti-sigma-YlaC factor YlaD
MTCGQVQSLLSSYLDGAVTGRQMFALGEHLNECGECRDDYSALRQTQRLLSRVGRAQAPDDLSLKVRLAISREAARRREPVFGNLRLRVANAFRGDSLPRFRRIQTMCRCCFQPILSCSRPDSTQV